MLRKFIENYIYQTNKRNYYQVIAHSVFGIFMKNNYD